jgi:hypothetical protein
MPDSLIAAAGPSALPLLLELGAAALTALLFVLRGPARRLVRRVTARRPVPARARARRV